MQKNIRLSARTASAIKSSLLRKVYKGAIALAIMTYFCPGQVINSQDDSLLIDEFRTVKPVSADTAHRQREIARPLGADSISKQRETSKPNAADTMPQQQEIGKPVSADSMTQQQEIGKTIIVDTVPQQEEIGKPVTTEPVRPSHAEETTVEPVVHNLSPFSSDRMHCFGVSLDYFSYAEVSNLADVFPGYPVGYPPNFVQGSPKSTEHGLMFGFNYQGTLRQHGSPILFRPDLEVQIGIHQAYVGSTQAQPITDRRRDTIGFKFLPAQFYKSNYFAQAGVDIGYCRTHAIVPFYIYSGIKGKLWYRDMTADTTSYASQITNAEVYYWFSIPLGLALSMPVSHSFAWGVDVSCDLMFKGYMQVLLSAFDAENTYKTVSPVVTLGNRPAFHIEFPCTFKLPGENIFRLTPYLTIYSFGQSETEISQNFINNIYQPGSDQVFNEPSSNSWLLGLKIQLGFLSPYTRTR